MKAFVINLATNRDRREYMESMLTQYGIEYEIVEGLNGKEADQQYINNIYDSHKSKEVNGQDLSRSEIGCAYSHTLVYQKILEQNLPLALVLEDDVELNVRIRDALKLAEYKYNNKKFDWLQIDYIEPGSVFLLHWCRLVSLNIRKLLRSRRIMRVLLAILFAIIKFPIMVTLSIYEGIRNYWYMNSKRGAIVQFQRPLYLASAYIITNDGAQKLLEINRPVFLTADRLPNYARTKGLIYRAYAPLIAKQLRNVFDSNIVPGEHVNRKETQLQFIGKAIRYVFRHIFTRPNYLYNYIYKYRDANYIEKLDFLNQADTIEALKNKSLIRLGDGEIHIHNGGDVACYQRYDARLREYLHNIIIKYSDRSNYILGVPKFALEDNATLVRKGLLSCWMPLKASIRTYFNRSAKYVDSHIFYREGGFDTILRPILESHKIIMITGEHNVRRLESAAVRIHEKLDIEFITVPEIEAFEQFDSIIARFSEWIRDNHPLDLKSLDDIELNDNSNNIALQTDRDNFYRDINDDLREHFDSFNMKYRVLVSAGPAAKAIVYELSKPYKTFAGGYICYDIGKGVETMYQENKVKNMIG